MTLLWLLSIIIRNSAIFKLVTKDRQQTKEPSVMSNVGWRVDSLLDYLCLSLIVNLNLCLTKGLFVSCLSSVNDSTKWTFKEQ